LYSIMYYSYSLVMMLKGVFVLVLFYLGAFP